MNAANKAKLISIVAKYLNLCVLTRESRNQEQKTAPIIEIHYALYVRVICGNHEIPRGD